ncbi:conserved protein of unknown function [Pararobbsia alpina]|uniref:hypothetical protein n=1 Tax=Pararobbsia alpina TaxID=621374 RepID=UPI0039A6B71C
MSIALQVQVDRLQQRVDEAEQRSLDLAVKLSDALDRIAAIEQSKTVQAPKKGNGNG